jgi:hypothetical protein
MDLLLIALTDALALELPRSSEDARAGSAHGIYIAWSMELRGLQIVYTPQRIADR